MPMIWMNINYHHCWFNDDAVYFYSVWNGVLFQSHYNRSANHFWSSFFWQFTDFQGEPSSAHTMRAHYRRATAQLHRQNDCRQRHQHHRDFRQRPKRTHDCIIRVWVWMFVFLCALMWNEYPHLCSPRPSLEVLTHANMVDAFPASLETTSPFT